MSGEIGKSRLESLPMELIHEIHFLHPDNALLASSKTLCLCFTVKALPTPRTARHVKHLWIAKRLQHSPGTRHESLADFVLSKRYTHSIRMIKGILKELYESLSSEVEVERLKKLFPSWKSFAILDLTRPPFDPSVFLRHNNAPRKLILWLYLTLPTCPQAMAKTTRCLLVERRIKEARVLLFCGADKSSLALDELEEPLPNSSYKLVKSGKPADPGFSHSFFRTCQAVKPAMRQILLCLQKTYTTPRFQNKRPAPPCDSRVTLLLSPAFKEGLPLQTWMLPMRRGGVPTPPYGTVDQTQKFLDDLRKHTGCQRREIITRASIEYVEGLLGIIDKW